MVIHHIINDIDLEVNIEKINEKGNKVAEHWQDYEGLPSAGAVRPDGQNVKVVGILMMIMMIKMMTMIMIKMIRVKRMMFQPGGKEGGD